MITEQDATVKIEVNSINKSTNYELQQLATKDDLDELHKGIIALREDMLSMKAALQLSTSSKNWSDITNRTSSLMASGADPDWLYWLWKVSQAMKVFDVKEDSKN